MYEDIYKDVKYTFTSDLDPLYKIYKRLEGVFSQNEEQKQTGRDIEFVIRNIKHKFKRYNQASIPFIDTEIWEHIASKIGTNLIESIRSETVLFFSNKTVHRIGPEQRKRFHTEVERSDRKCVNNYTTRSRHLSIRQREVLTEAGIQAARKLKIIQDVYGRKDSIEQNKTRCVDNTARSTNSGAPFYGRKNEPRLVKDTKAWINNMLDRPNAYSVFKNPLIEMPTALFHRIQPTINEAFSQVNVKIRQVWCVPQRIIALEYLYFANILERVSNNNKYSRDPIYSSSMTNLDISLKIISRLRNCLSNDELIIFAMDYSKYDQSIPNDAIDIFYAICKHTMQMSEKYIKLYKILWLYSKYTPMVFRDAVYFKRKGIMSGSFITNLFDTWWNLTLWVLSRSIELTFFLKRLNFFSYSNLLEGVYLNEVLISSDLSEYSNLGICGDDCTIATTHLRINIHKHICTYLGMNITENLITKDSTKDIFFLGRLWDYQNRPYQTELYKFGHLLLRTSFYKKSDLNFDISEELTVHRLLSITLQHFDGKLFLEKYFFDFIKLQNFISKGTGFYLLKDFPLVENKFRFINKIDAMSWKNM